MSFLDLQDISQFSLVGFTLNVEERSVLSTSLKVKADDERLPNVYLWGKILGIQKDYLIAQAPHDNPFSRKYFYSTDLTTWLQLPEVTPEEMARIEKINKKFTGDPAFEYTVAVEETDSAEKPLDTPTSPPIPPITEEKRLAGIIALITYETEIVPRGAYYRDATHKLSLNPMFKGLGAGDLGRLSNYFHFREGFNINTKTLAERINNFDETIDIFESIEKDQPKGCWSVQVDNTSAVSVLRSLEWPGYVFFHTPSPTKWGSIYFGQGLKNHNLGFMLP
ncbi:Radial spoke head protein 9 [Chytridiales sp. JEL 0842]|nr:Radial spoke head protein 9 [Chytridiales sp. JEL 0842]